MSPVPSKWQFIAQGDVWSIFKTDPLNFALIEKKKLAFTTPTAAVDGWTGDLAFALKVLVKKELEVMMLKEGEESTKQRSLDTQLKEIAKKIDNLAKTLFTQLSEKLPTELLKIQIESE